MPFSETAVGVLDSVASPPQAANKPPKKNKIEKKLNRCRINNLQFTIHK
jgi:hypothetical protein